MSREQSVIVVGMLYTGETGRFKDLSNLCKRPISYGQTTGTEHQTIKACGMLAVSSGELTVIGGQTHL